MAEEIKAKTPKFAVYAEKQDEAERPLILLDLTFSRLMEDVVIPYESGEPFFIDGVPLERKELRKMKILHLKDGFSFVFNELHWGMRTRRPELQKIYGEQYNVRFEAALREESEDVTSQIIKAYTEKVKPRGKKLEKNREEIYQAASVFFWQMIKTLGGL